jgi:hypothetical protein
MTSASRDPVDGGYADANRAQIGDVHENNVKYVSAGHTY